MLRGAIVPKDDRARAPTESALDFGDGGLGVEMREQSLAFLCRQAFDMAREGGVDVQRLFARLGMGAPDGVELRRLLFVQFVGALEIGRASCRERVCPSV